MDLRGATCFRKTGYNGLPLRNASTSATTMRNPFANCLQGLPTLPLLIGALVLGLAPFQPEPHLLQKLRMLAAGELTRPIDIFDLVLHGTLPLLLGVKLVCKLRHGSSKI